MGIYSVLVHVCTFGSMVRFGQEEKDQHLVSFGWYLCLLLLSSFLCLPQIFFFWWAVCVPGSHFLSLGLYVRFHLGESRLQA